MGFVCKYNSLFLRNKYQGVQYPGYITACADFKKQTSRLFPGCFYHFTFPQAIIQFLCICCGHFIYFILAILIGCNVNTLGFSFAFFFFLLANAVKHLFMCLFSILFGEISLHAFGQVLTGLFAFLLLNFQRFLCSLAISPLSDTGFENILLDCFFSLVQISSE